MAIIIDSYQSRIVYKNESVDMHNNTVMGQLFVSSGGSASHITLSGQKDRQSGDIYVLFGGTVEDVTVDTYGDYYVSSGGTANRTTVNSDGFLEVSPGGIANSITLISGGSLNVSSGATATDILWTPCEGYLRINDGAVVTFANEYSGVYYGTDNQLLSHEATMDGKEVGSKCEMYVMSGGTATNIIWTPCEGHVYVSDGAIVTFANEYSGVYYGSNNQLRSQAVSMNGKIVGHDNEMYVMSGGTANITTVTSDGSLFVSGGGIANGTIIRGVYSYEYFSELRYDSYCYGYLTVLNGGTVNNTRVNSYGFLIVSSGGTANDTTVNDGGRFYVSSGGILNSTTVKSGGRLHVSSGGTANSTTVSSGGESFILSGGTADETMVKSGGRLHISSRGTADNTTVNDSGDFFILNGGTAVNTTVKRSGRMYVSSGGTANSTTVSSGGTLFVSSGGTANSTTVHSGGDFFILSGGTANEIIENGGFVDVSDGANAVFASNIISGLILFNASATVHSGTTANSATVNGSGRMYVSSGGTANSTTINSDGSVIVSSGGTVDDTAINSGGGLHISSGGTANDTIVNSGGGLYISFGGTATIAFNPWQGDIFVDDGAIVSYLERDAEVYFGCNGEFVHKADAIGSTILQSSAIVYSGATAKNIILNSSGYLVISNGGTADSTTVNSGGNMFISNGGLTNNTKVSGGILHISSGGIANNTTVFTNGDITVFSGGIADSIKTYAGGIISVASGGTITGKMSFLAGTFFFVEDGAVIDFDLTRTNTDAKALLSDWSLVQGMSDYTLTVDGNQKTGVYKLAGAADEFDSVITVQNTLGESLGVLAVGEKVTIAEVDYTLNIVDDCLTVTVNDAGSVPSDTDTVAPTDPVGLITIVDGQNVALLWNESTDDTGVKEYIVKYSLDGEVFTVRTTAPHYVLKDADYGTWSWSAQAVDFAGNTSAATVGDAFTVTSFKPYKVEYSADNFEHAIRFTVTTPTLNAFRMSSGTYQMRVKQEGSSEWLSGDSIVAAELDTTPQLIKSDADGNADVFFANPIGTWESGYLAQHVGSIGDWGGTKEYATLFGKNKLADIIEGSTDANILLMTDDDNGDALFVDDIYTALPGSVSEQQSRIAQIDEIRAGFGNDIVDMTSQRFEYIGDGLTIRGGAGNDTIWANKGDNSLFGDAGNDRIVGASGNDIIAGGIGNDRMHGGGGDDVFTFCDNWGSDNVEQLAGGSVTLWFTSGSEGNWNAETLTYTDGANSVKVSGVAADKITLKFGVDGSDQFATLSGMGAFFDATTERIFEESGKGILASL